MNRQISMISEMKTFIITLLCTCAAFVSTAQQVVASSGHTGTMTGYTVSWTLGEPVIETFTGAGNMVTQGQHQTRLVVTAANEITLPGIELMVFPNPAKNYLKISGLKEQATIKIIDITGKIVFTGVTRSSDEILSMEAFFPGIYLLSLDTPGGHAVFKVIKQ